MLRQGCAKPDTLFILAAEKRDAPPTSDAFAE